MYNEIVYASDEESIEFEPSEAEGYGGVGGPSKWRMWATSALLALLTFFVFSDQSIVAPNLTAIAREFGMTDQERDWKLGGILSMLFFIVGGPASLLAGYLADTVGRRILLIMVFTAMGGVPCVCTFFVKNFAQILATRTFAGFSMGGALPILFSLLGDLFPSSHRTYVGGAFALVSSTGQGVGLFIAGITGAKLGWRYVFLFVGIPMIVVAIATWLLVPEPEKGAADGRGPSRAEPEDRGRSRAPMLSIFRVLTNNLIYLQATFGCLPWGVMFAFMTDYLAQDVGLGVVKATTVATSFSVGYAIGVLLNSIIGQKLQNWKPSLMGLMIGSSSIVGIFPTVFIIYSDAAKIPMWILQALACVGGCILSAPGSILPSILINANKPSTRGSAAAAYNLFNDVGKGLGPIFGSLLIERKRSLFLTILQKIHSVLIIAPPEHLWMFLCFFTLPPTVTGSRRSALILSFSAWLPCGLILLGLMYSYPRDLETAKVEKVATELRDHGT
ncbi:hypothetical protein NDN08_003918 [Rhodosorus marinus]|uniref:Major facilitator superfamily (MFS) profile domain-containing protein n=1 Tax=Rhodosorus marinus TaxID=101924 RepID=A0AAV8UK43_9RHOD|nr:hypothetical protein NDN08_003918 [Rhodosorus marinus]